MRLVQRVRDEVQQGEILATVESEKSQMEMPSPVMGAEDFSYVLREVPGAMFFLGVCPPENPNPFVAPSCHSNRMVLNEDGMATGVAVHVGVATAFLDARGQIT